MWKQSTRSWSKLKWMRATDSKLWLEIKFEAGDSNSSQEFQLRAKFMSSRRFESKFQAWKNQFLKKSEFSSQHYRVQISSIEESVLEKVWDQFPTLPRLLCPIDLTSLTVAPGSPNSGILSWDRCCTLGKEQVWYPHHNPLFSPPPDIWKFLLDKKNQSGRNAGRRFGIATDEIRSQKRNISSKEGFTLMGSML